jgi:hypothetical protein
MTGNLQAIGFLFRWALGWGIGGSLDDHHRVPRSDARAPVYGFLFQQRGPAGMQAAGGLTVPGIGGNGESINPQAMSASALYRVSFAVNGRGARR